MTNSLPLPRELKTEAQKGNNNFEGLKVAHEKFTWNGRQIPCMGRYGGHKWQGFWLKVLDARAAFPLSTEFRLAKAFKQTCNVDRYTNNYTLCNKANHKTSYCLPSQPNTFDVNTNLGTTKYEKLYNFELYG